MDNIHDALPHSSIAIVGMAGRFPGAANVTEFWHNLITGTCSTHFFTDDELLAAGVIPDLLQNPNYVKAGSVLEDFDCFDAAFFGFTPREAEIMDPQSRLLVQCAWDALADAGYEPTTFSSPVGIFAGKRFPWYMIYNVGSNPELMETVGALQVGLSNQNDSLASMIAYKLDLKGPGVNVQTYCSTSLVAVHLACQSLLAYECDMALAGGAAVQIPHAQGYLYQEGGIASPDGYCRTFDAAGQGSVFGDGLALVLLKRLDEALADGDNIYAVIRGSALNNDGIRRVGYTAPGLNGQAAVIAEALGTAGVSADSISYVEAHGTGTPLGDSVELEAMNRAFRHSSERTQFCAIGSVKPNVGHLDRAAGVTGLIKTALALKHGLLPPTLNFKQPNRDFDWDNSPFYVNTELRPWYINGSGRRRAGVSSFGLGGTNVHMVLEEAPSPTGVPSKRTNHLLLLSAKTEAALAQRAAVLAEHLRTHPELDLADVAYTLQVGRAEFNHRRVIQCESTEEAIDALQTAVATMSASPVQPERPVNFLLLHSDAYYPGLGQPLYQSEPHFRDWVDRCCELLHPLLGVDLRPYHFTAAQTAPSPSENRNGNGRNGYVSPVASEAIQNQSAQFVFQFGLAQLLQSWGIQPQALLGSGVGEVVAACLADVMPLSAALTLVTQQPFDPATTLQSAKIPLISTVTGSWLTAGQATDPAYWTQLSLDAHVDDRALAKLLAAADAGLLLVGSGQTAVEHVRHHPACGAEQGQRVWSLLPERGAVAPLPPTRADLEQTLGEMWLTGVMVAWSQLYAHERRRRVSLPSYPFNRERYWVAPARPMANGRSTNASAQSKKADMGDWFYRPHWRPTPSPAATAQAENWLFFTDTVGLAEEVGRRCTGTAVLVRPGAAFAQISTAEFSIRPHVAADYVALWYALKHQDTIPAKIVHMGSVGAGTHQFAAAQTAGFDSLIHLVQALSQENVPTPLSILVVTSNAQAVTGTEPLYPEKTVVLAVCRAILQETALTSRAVDFDLSSADLTDLADWLTVELNASGDHLEVAYRHGQRYGRTFEAEYLDEKRPSLLRTQGTYLITGGLGSVGLVLAEHLARTYQARLVLIGRSPLPEPEAWTAWLESHQEGDPTSRKVRQLQTLQTLGAEVLTLAVDIADRQQMTTAWNQAVARFGPIHGVIHAAGISDLQSFQSVDLIMPEQCRRHFQPKVHGLYVLDELVAKHQPDFCLLFSSLASVLGGLGFVAYAAANIFMDSLAQERSRHSATRWLSVNWDTWRVRPNQNAIVGKTVAQFEMTPAEGIAAFERVLAHESSPQIVHSTGDLTARLQQWIRLDKEPVPQAAASRPNTAADYERQITAIWQELLGIDQIGSYDNFFDLGGNSLIGMTLIARLKKLFDVPIPITALFEAPTVSALARYLCPQPMNERVTETVVLAERRRQARKNADSQSIAIVGMSGRFPGAPDLQTFWQNLHDGVESITFFTDEELKTAGVSAAELAHSNYVKARPILEDVDQFDATFFGFNPREAELTDPQHRLFLECAWEAMEIAGYDPKTYPGLVGVFGGMGLSFYLLGMTQDPEFLRSLGAYEASYQLAVGNDKDSLTTAVSYKLNLKGPSLSVQTFCSTSLVAVHLACQSLRNGECDMALAGGVSVRVPVRAGYIAAEGGMESPDGHCRTFDARSAGTLFGDGAGIVLLKRLEDAVADGDTIYACIKGSAVNNDGSLKVGYAAPSIDGQAEVISSALEAADITADTISYVEAHGTATPLGDPIEVAALTKAFRRTTDGVGYCAIGSVKTNIGHVDRAAGVSGLIKTVLALHHEQLPPSLHFEKPNPEIDFENSPFVVNSRLTPWPRVNGRPRRAGVSSLGMGGTNAHVILEEPPRRADGDIATRPCQLLLLSAQSEAALAQMTANIGTYLHQQPDCKLADVAYTLQVGRTRMPYRRSLAFSDRDELLATLESAAALASSTHHSEREAQPVTFIFPDADENIVGHAAALYVQEPTFRAAVERCLDYLVTLEYAFDLRPMLTSTIADFSDLLTETAVVQPATFIIEYGLAQLLQSWGIQPQALLGSGVGDYVAACLAGIFSAEDGLTLVVDRACRLAERSSAAPQLAISLNPPHTPYLHNGSWITAEQATDLATWLACGSQLQGLHPLAALLPASEQLLLAIGEGHDLPTEKLPILSTLPPANSDQPLLPFLMQTVGQLWLRGVTLDWTGFYQHERRQRLPLPTYPFQRQRYWRRLSHGAVSTTDLARGTAVFDPIETLLAQEPPKVTDVGNWGYVPSWKRMPPPDVEIRAVGHHWLIFADDCGFADSLRQLLLAAEQQVTLVKAGDQFKYQGQNCYTIRTNEASDYHKLMQALHRQGTLPHKIVHMWTVTPANEAAEQPLDSSMLDRGFYSLLFLTQALTSLSSEPRQITIISSDMQDVTTTTRLQPSKALLLGPYKVIPQELAHLRTRSIDINLPAPHSAEMQTMVAQLWDELTTVFNHEVIALRHSSRWLQQYEPTHIPTAREANQLLRPGGVYLITGGLGGIGLALADYLVSTFQARLVLLGRSGLPPRSEWEAIVAREGDAAGLGHKLQRLLALEAQAAELLIVEADVTNRVQMETAVSQARRRFGTIHGVFHTAGVPPRGLMSLKEAERAAAVLAPKVQGTAVLHELFSDANLDFMLLFSSISAVTGGGPGQVDYSAANAFMDTFARCWDGKNGRVLSVGWGEWLWDSWQDGLDGFDAGTRAYFQARRQRFGIAFKEGFELIRRLLSQRLAHIVISTQPFQQVADGFSTEMIFEQQQTREKKARYPRPDLGIPYVAALTSLELQIGNMWSDLLGIEEIGVHDNFFELGGNSLVGVDLVTRLRRELEKPDIPLNLLYEFPTISQMANQLQAQSIETEIVEHRLSRGKLRRQRALERRRD